MRVPVKIHSNKSLIKLLNGIFNLTDKEVDIVAAFLDVKQEYPKNYLFSSEMKKVVVSKANIGSYNTINVYMQKLVEKRVLFKQGKVYKMNPMLRPINEDIEITFICQKI